MNCDYIDVPEADLAKAKVLFPTVASVIGGGSRADVRIDANFYEIGGNSLNSIYTVTKLQESRLRDRNHKSLYTAKNLGEVLNRMKTSTDGEPIDNGLNEEEHVFEMLNDSHKEDVTEIITESFYNKADLEQWLMEGIAKEDYRIMMELLWKPLVEKNLSFAVKSSQNGRTIGVALNFDLWDEPEFNSRFQINDRFRLLEYLEAPIEKGNCQKERVRFIHNFMMATSGDPKSS